MTTNNYNYSKELRNAIRTAIQPWVEWKHIPHCTVVPQSTRIVQSQVTAISAYEKFARYALDPTNSKNKGKAAMFESWGYTAADSKWMMAEYERQAKEKYIAGEYWLGELNSYGQRINIYITIPRKDGTGSLTYKTGWIAEPNGKIRLVTPYGGR